MTTLAEVALEAFKNPVFAGVMAAAVTGGAMMTLQKLMPQLGRIAREQLCTSLVVYNDEEFYYKLQVFMSRHRYSQAARSTSVEEWYSHKEDEWKWGLAPGAGWHFFWHKGAFYIVFRHIDAQPAQGGWSSYGPKRGETLYIYTLGRSQKPLRRLLEEVHNILQEKDSVPIYIWNQGQFVLAQHREKRSLDTIFIPDAQKERLVNDIQQFIDSREVYRQRGTPYRRGYMLEGPPGTGKSSIIFALAGHFNKPVYIVNPATLPDDNALQKCFNDVRRNGVLLIEDIDSVDVTEQRTEKPKKAATAPKKEGEPAAETPKTGITLSGLLNGIDGVIARDGRLLFITSNHANNLDAALVRPGRIDVREHLGLMELPEAIKMFRCFHPKGDTKLFERWITPQLPMSPASMQNVLLQYDESDARNQLKKAA